LTTYHTMMSAPPEAKEGDEICPICKKPKSKHTNEEILACSKKLSEFYNKKDGETGKE